VVIRRHAQGRAEAQLAIMDKCPDPFYLRTFMCEGDLSPIAAIGSRKVVLLSAIKPTRELIETFYGRLMAGQERAEALRDALLAMK
jgi:hypothetical protein